MNNHKELEVWEIAVQLTKDIYNTVKKFPKEEKFGLVDQIKRSTISISSNIAEGCGRESNKEFLHFFINILCILSRIRIFNNSKLRNRLYHRRGIG